LDRPIGGAGVRLGSSTEYTDGDLEEVNDRGIVPLVETHGRYPARPLFYPWSAVIQLS
jgi:hypothetical protein